MAAENETVKEQPEKTVNVLIKNLSTIIASICAIVAAFFAFYQTRFDKMTDLQLEQIRIENAEKMAMYNRNTAFVYGALSEVRNKLDADRCFIIQPHPPDRYHYLSVVIESDKPGVSAVKDIFQNIPMSDIAHFAKMLSTNVWLYFDDVNAQVEDRKALSMMLIAGSSQIGIIQLTNAKNEWVGSLVVENINHKPFDRTHAMEVISNAANLIQFILPPIN